MIRGAIGLGVWLGALTVGCAGRLPPCPSLGGPAWRELESPHFRLRTDDDPEEARATLQELELFRAAMLTIFHAPPDLKTGRLPVVVLRAGWYDVANGQAEAFYTHALFQPLIVMRAGADVLRQEVIKHELCHYFSARVMPVQPRWLSEGLATYFQTIEYDPDRRQLSVGKPPAELLAVRQFAVARIVEGLAQQGRAPDEPLFYAAAWITVHYLMNHHATELTAYQESLGARSSPAEAWARAFGALTPIALEDEIRRYADGGDYDLLIFPFSPPPAAPITERLLSDADVHATRALLYLAGGPGRAGAPQFEGEKDDFRGRARGELNELFRLEPAHVVGRAIAHFGLGDPVDLAQAQVTTHDRPAEWLAWLLYAEALRERRMDGQGQAAQKAIEAAWDDPSVVITVIETVRPRGTP